MRVVGTEELVMFLGKRPAEETVGGYRIKVRYSSGTNDEKRCMLAGEVVLKSLEGLKRSKPS